MIVLIRPPHIMPSLTFSAQSGVPPLGLAYLAAALEEAKLSLCVIDGVGLALDQLTFLPEQNLWCRGLSFDQLIELIPEKPKMIMISLMFANEWIATYELIKKIKLKFPLAAIVVGGEFASADWKFLLSSYLEIEVCAIGEGERTIVDLALGTKELSQIPGIAFRSNNGKIIKTEQRKNISPLSLIAEPAWNYLPLEEYLSRKLGDGFFHERIIPMLASRGCPYQCTFCSSPEMWTTLYQLREVSAVILEIKKWVSVYQITHVQFYDLTAIVNRDWIESFATALIQDKLNITWSLPSGTRVEALTPANIYLLYQSGCRYISLSPESGSIETLKRIKKNLNPKRFKKVIKSSCKVGIITKANLLFELPNQNNREILDSFIFMLKMLWWGLDDIVCIRFVPYPGSELHRQLELSGKINKLDSKAYSLFLSEQVNNSYDNLNARSLKISLILILFPAIFYSFSFLIRPQRLLNFFIRVVNDKPVTLIEKVASDIICKFKKLLLERT